MVGGGRGAFIGGVHRAAANLDGQFELVAGAFSSDPKKSKLSGKDFYVDPKRTYASYQEMAEKEAAPTRKRANRLRDHRGSKLFALRSSQNLPRGRLQRDM